MKIVYIVSKIIKVFRSRRDLGIIKNLKGGIWDLPSPKKISYWWGWGSLLGLFLVIQILTGLFLAMHYISDIRLAFSSVKSINRDIGRGWLIRKIHAKGASGFFILLYLHIGRSIYYGAYVNHLTWKIGILVYIVSMGTAFLGYVLPWGQMSYWGATVITNFASTVPYIGKGLVEWIWGGFAVRGPTLTRFFTLHYLLPFIIIILVVFHLVFLHDVGSKNPLGVERGGDKILFHPYFTVKDVVGFLLGLGGFFFIVLSIPDYLGDPENYLESNPLVTPIHIQPEWYFLPAYAILRAIPNKLGGVIALLLSILALYLVPFFRNSFSSSVQSQIRFWGFVVNIMILLWLGSNPIEAPYIWVRVCCTISYFLFFFYALYSKKKAFFLRIQAYFFFCISVWGQ